MLNNLIEFLCNPKIILFIGIILVIMYLGGVDNIYSQYKKLFYIGGIIVSLITIFGMGNIIPKLTVDIKQQNALNFEKRFLINPSMVEEKLNT